MNTIFTFFTFSLVFTLNDALYSSNSDVIELTETNFNSRVKDSDHLWVIEFYAPWCGHCQAFASEYSKAATVLKGFVKVGGVDADQYKSLGGQYGVKGFPTVKLMYKGKVIDYTGPRTANGIVDAAFRELRRVVDNRLGGKEESSSGSDKDVIELTDDNFRKTVLESDDIWLVEFFAPWCGHCKNLEPHWKKAASELKGKVKLGALDATVYTVTANQYGVKGFPTIKFFPKGRANKHKVEDYDGGRTSGDIVTWALNKHIQDLPSPDVIQLTNEQVVKDVCESSQLCVISFLPHILDCDAKCRNGYLDTLKKVGDKFKQNGWGYLWSEAVSQPELEDSLGIGGFGYPAMAAVNIRKMKYSWLRGSFSQDGINEFLRDLSYGKGSSVPVKGAKLPKIHKVEEWDGKDGVPPVEEEYEDLNEGKSEL